MEIFLVGFLEKLAFSLKGIFPLEQSQKKIECKIDT